MIPMTGLEPGSCGVWSKRSVNCATTTALNFKFLFSSNFVLKNFDLVLRYFFSIYVTMKSSSSQYVPDRN